jgi:CheY-like chemotaxis protein
MANVLVVDPDPESVAVAARKLGESGHAVVVADSGSQALELLRTSAIDVLVADLATAARLGAARNGADVVPMVVTGDRVRARDLLAAGRAGNALLGKPYGGDELTCAVARALESRHGFSGEVYGLSLVDLLQLLHYARRSLRLVVVPARGATGVVDMRDGEVIDARSGTQRGATALRELLGRDAGHVELRPLPPAAEVALEHPFDALLLDSLRLLDETGREADGADPAVSYLHDLFAAIAAEAGDIGAGLAVVALAPSLGVATSVRGSVKAEGWEGSASALLADVVRAAGGSPIGRAEWIGDQAAIAVLWNLTVDAMFIVADGQRAQSATWFRTAVSLLGRGLASKDGRKKEEEPNG